MDIGSDFPSSSRIVSDPVDFDVASKCWRLSYKGLYTFFPAILTRILLRQMLYVSSSTLGPVDVELVPAY